MKKLHFACFVHISCLVLVLTVAGSWAKECGDPECKTPIATGYATLRYMGGGGQKVNLAQGERLQILGRYLGKDKDFLVRKQDGKEGLASTKFVKEMNIMVKKKDLILISEDGNVEQIAPSGAIPPNVIDGTTLSNAGIVEQKVAEDIPVPVKEKTPDLEVVPSGVNETPDSLPTVSPAVVSTEAGEEEQAASEIEEDKDEEDKGGDEAEDDEESEDEPEIKNTEEVTGSSPKQPEEQPLAASDDKVEETSQSSESSVTSSEIVLEEKPDEKPSAAVLIETVAEAPALNTVETPFNEESAKTAKEPLNSSEEAATSTDETLFNEESTKTVEELSASSEKATTSIEEIPAVHEPEMDHPLKNELESVNPEMLELTTSNDGIDHIVHEDPEDLSNETISETQTSEEIVQSSVEDLRHEIPVNEEPELNPDVPATASFNQDVVVKEVVQQDSALPQPPHGLLRGGLGNLLAHSHHHHHHHGHGHSHGHQHHHHDNGHHQHDHQHKDSSHEQTDQHQHKEGGPFIGGFGEIEERVPLDSHEHSTVEEKPVMKQQNEVAPEDGFCDQQSCPQPNPSQPSPHQQHANGFHHPMVGSVPTSDAMTTQQQKLQHQPQQQDDVVPSAHTDDLDQEEMDYAKMFIMELFKLSDLILLLGITSFTLIVFSLGHYLINKNRKEKPLIYKLNMVERDLMASHKENGMLKSDLLETRHKLTSIENNSFGSNDMVIALRQDLDEAEQAKLELQEQIASLEKELENAAEAGLELNKMVAELLNQSGSDSIALTVDELQKQLNEQQQTILSMNTTLADKSRENSELQITLASQSAKFGQEFEEQQQTLKDLKLERHNMEIELNNVKGGQSSQLETLRKETSVEIVKLNKEVKSFQFKWEESKKALGAAEAKVEALEECIKEIKRGNTNGTVDGLIDSAELKAQVTVVNREKASLQDRLQGEIVARQLLDDHVKMINEEVSTLKKEFVQAEKDKLEAETRLEVLSSYFKEKETQLQKDLSIKEAMWMQQQGETTSTVERIRLMQDEIQQLKSQNDKLRAEIEAQATAHKAQYTALETRSHDAWLAARQAERRLEESRNESSALRRKLTVLGDVSATNTTTDGLIPNAVPSTDLNMAAPSPIRVESPNAPMMALPPPPFIPPPFGPPFMPPFMPPPGPGEMRPAPLGRLMSPPPNRYSPSLIDTRDRYSPDRGRYSPDSRYDYSVMSNYETETDFSPPPSPPPHSRRSNFDREREPRSDRDRDRDHDLRDRERDMRERDGRTSGSGGGAERSKGTGGGYPKAFSPPGMRTTSPPIQDPRNKKYQGSSNHYSDDDFDEW